MPRRHNTLPRARIAGGAAAAAMLAATPALAQAPAATTPTVATTPEPPPPPAPAAEQGQTQHRHASHEHADPPPKKPKKRRQPQVHKVRPPKQTREKKEQPAPISQPALSSFGIPVFLLPIYQAAGIEYGIRWELLAAINEIETDYGRNLGVSSAGALGWMQFMPGTWRRWGVDGNRDGRRDPYNPVDAIFSAARYLKAAGGETDERRAVFAYNHADWYVDSVLLRAKLIEAYPPAAVAALTGLTQGRFPVAARARYTRAGHRRLAAIYTRRRAPVVAVNDGVVRKIGTSRRKGRYIDLQDVYGNHYTYSHLGSTADAYPVPRAGHTRTTPSPATPATPPVEIRERLFAHPHRPAARRHGGLDQLLENHASTYDDVFAPALGLDAKHAALKPLKRGSHVVAGTVLGHTRKAPLWFQIRPAGRRAPLIQPRPILDGWKLLESTAIYDASGRNALTGERSAGQVLLMPKSQLVGRVLHDRRITVYRLGRRDIRTGQIDRRVLATLEFLAESGLDPTVTSLRSGHSYLTTSGNVSEHSSGNAVDIAAVNGIPILGHQQPGGIADRVVRRLMLLQGAMAPHQIISLLDLGANTMAMPDHANHVHVGFRPAFGAGPGTLGARQWDVLLRRLGTLDQPRVPTRPSRFALR